jgi:hypothetical protein
MSAAPRPPAIRSRTRRWLAMSVLLVGASPLAQPGLRGAAGEVDVRAANGLLTVHTKTTPLVDVLEQISRQTGLKLVYEGTRPTQRVTVALEAVPEAEALRQLVEGLGLNYLLQTDVTGGRAMLLVIAETKVGAPAVGAGASSRPQPPPRIESPEPPVDEEPPFEPVPEGGVPGPQPGASVFDPATGWVPAPSPPAGFSEPAATPGFGSPGVPQPMFPQAASQPMPTPYLPPGASTPF